MLLPPVLDHSGSGVGMLGWIWLDLEIQPVSAESQTELQLIPSLR